MAGDGSPSSEAHTIGEAIAEYVRQLAEETYGRPNTEFLLAEGEMARVVS